ncbi:DsbA family oxidoreductase [Motilimonas pumila]|uniref:DsbA family oxidoreductase n=1 Tax=Motilimonas pumila TaxID=2303987 RepID=A0A418YD38_9GAMM|nr:DsbA family oxidoreductase [Motilimonas pumila]RJG42445.1 DsbA family oxidoreductase [Motilimonas pumila]
MVKRIKLDIISDVVCPWCIVGYKHLEAAIEELGIQGHIDIEWQPFELNPDMPAEGENLRDHVARKYGASPEDSDSARANIASKGAEYGFVFDYFDKMKMVNTLDAHVLLEHAKQFDLQHALKMRLFSAFFTEHKDISKREVLLSEAQSVGIDKLSAEAVLNDPASKQVVQEVESQWHQMGVSAVPTVVFNRESALTGAHPKESFIQVLQELMNQEGAAND